jgi:sigma-E factor negative regulatory protein RseB
VVVAWAVAAAARADEPTRWLQRMNQALTASSYEGTIAHWQGGKVEMLRIIHRVQDGAVSERLVSLDGSGREFIRTGSQVACYLPDQHRVLVERRDAAQSLIGLPQITGQTASFYDIQEVARARFNRHDTHLITVSPKDSYRYGYRLWIDDATGMPLKTQLCDSHGHTIEQVVFASFTPSAHIADSAFKPEVATEGFQWLRSDGAREVHQHADALAGPGLKLPPGFRLTSHSAQALPGLNDPVEHIVFTDGLASVSVFVEVFTSGNVAGEVVESARVGPSSAFSMISGDRKITAVGEVPPATVRFIANSVRSEGGAQVPPTLGAAAAPTPGMAVQPASATPH